jgi:hypothetical protein
MDYSPTLYAIVSILIAIPSLFANGAVIAILLKRQDLRHSWNLITLPVNAGEMSYSIVILVSMIHFMVLYPEPFSPTVCNVIGAMVFLSAGCNVLWLSLIAIERYRAICLAKPWKVTFWMRLALAIFAYHSTCTIVMLYDEQGYQITTAQVYCIVPWYSLNPIPRVIAILTVTALIATSSVLAFCYLRIFQHYHTLTKTSTRIKVVSTAVDNVRRQSKANVQSGNVQEDKLKAMEKRILITSVIYIAVYVSCWSPYAAMILYEVFTHTPCPALIHSCVACLGALSSLLNPICLLSLTPAYRSEIASWFTRRRQQGS